MLSRADGDADAGRDALRRASIPQLGDPNGVLVLDETGLVTQGCHAAGVARQDTGTAGQVEHGPIGVLLGDASPLGQALRDRERSRPTAWTDDRERCQQGGIPADRPCATKPQLARQLLARAFGAGVPATWVSGACVDGQERRLRRWLAAQPQADVRAVSGHEDGWRDGHQRPVQTILAGWPEDGWRRLSAGAGAKGPRCYAWRWLPLAGPLESGWRRWWLVRRRVSAPVELTAFVVCGGQTTALAEVVRVAGRRWTIERGVEAAKGAVGLDHDAVRSWTGWSRQITRALGALALVTIMRAGTIAGEAFNKRLRPPQAASPLTAFKARRGLASP